MKIIHQSPLSFWIQKGLNILTGIPKGDGAGNITAAAAGVDYAPASFTPVAIGNSGATKTVDWTSGDYQTITTTASCVLTFTAPVGPRTVLLKITHEASTTAYTYTWPGTVKWQSAVAPTTTNTSGGVDIISLFYDGTNYIGSFLLDVR